MDIIGNLGDPTKDAAAIQPVLIALETKAMQDLANILVPALEKSLTLTVIPQLEEALSRVLSGLTITISITKKE